MNIITESNKNRQVGDIEAEGGRLGEREREGERERGRERETAVLTCFSSFCCLRLKLSSSRALQTDMIKDQSMAHHTKSSL